MKNLRHGIEQVLLRVLIAIFSILSDRTALKFGRFIGRIMNSALSGRNEIAIKNLKLCNIPGDTTSHHKIIRQMYENYGMTMAEFARLNVYTCADFTKKITIPEFDKISKLYHEGHGILFLSAHYDNWELLIQAIAAQGVKTDIVVRRQHNLGVDRIMNQLRSKNENINVIIAETGPRGIIKALKKGHAVAVLMDVYGGNDAKKFDLFGQNTATITGACEIALKYHTPIVTGFIRRIDTENHILDNLQVLRTNPADQKIELSDIMEFYHKELEQAVRKYPEFWLWTHKRFKDVVDY